MNKKIMKYALVFFILLLFTGCEKNTSIGQIIKYDIPSPTYNLDPQFAVDSTAQLIIHNTFEGLLRQDTHGEILPAAANRYVVSQDNLTYTFYLNKEAKWSDDTPVTANDFVFAFKRMFNSQALSPFVQNYNSIKNAQKILDGELNYTQLGVSAKDSATFVIELEIENPFLLQLLTSTSAMPCNEKYVTDKRGKYGLDVDSIIFNGPFLVKTWNNEKHILLRQNENYYSEQPTIAEGVNLYIDRGDSKQLFLDGKSDACKVNFNELDKIEEKDYTVQSFDNITWAIIFNNKDEMFQNTNMRKALLAGINRDEIKTALPKNSEYTANYISPTMMVMDKNFREECGDVSYSGLYSKDARDYFKLALDELEIKKLPKTTIDIIDNISNKSIVPILQKSWQNNLSSYINTNLIEADEMNKKLKSGNFQIALIPFSPANSTPVSMLDYFLSTSMGNYSKYKSDEFDRLVTKSACSNELELSIDYLSQAEYLLINDGVTAPLYNASSFYAMGKGISKIEFSPYSDTVYFKYAEKQN